MKRTLLIVIAVTLPMISFAAGKDQGGYKKHSYGMGGCGVISLFIQDNTMIPQAGKAAIDYIIGLEGLNTFAMTTGTSNCTNNPGDHALLMEQQVFVSSNYESITREAAQGAGEHLVALAEVLGCDSNQFATLAQSNHAQIFGSEPNAALENVLGLIRQGNLSCDRV
ncbi:MAG: DUF3015 family protein [Deltaproteobacteria bacterium]|nr:DUF3015 family protein [Deltaproteobacteria bacterium]MBI3294684.1 DUF3015 family protein [Deltaproteobacteria bacterium]